MLPKKIIDEHHLDNILIDDVHDYHVKILQNHINHPRLKTNINDVTGSSTLITPNSIYEKKLKQAIVDKSEFI